MINESSVACVKHISRVMLATVIAFILMVCIFTVTAFAGEAGNYNVVISDNGYEYTIATKETEALEILNEANVKLGSNDKLDITGFNSGVGGKIEISRLNKVYIKFNNTIKSYDTYSQTVGEVLNEAGVLNEGLILNYSNDTAVINGMVITVDSPKIVTINADGKAHSVGVVNATVEQLLTEAGISLSGEDYVVPSLETYATDAMEINVFRVKYETVTKSEKIAHSTSKIDDDTIEKGKTKTETKGEDGEKSVTYKIKYVNGVQVEKQVLSSYTTKYAVTEVIRVGTKEVVIKENNVSSYNNISVGSTINGSYTYYCACETCCGKGSTGITASGLVIENGMENPYYVACNWLPLGSVIEVDGATYTVADRGGSGLSKVGRIDIFTPDGHNAAKKYGRGSATIKVLRLGW